MNRIQEVFGTSPVLLPVIHPISAEAAMTAVRVAYEAAVPGVFLIDQGMSEARLLELVIAVRALFPTLWIGLNLLSRSPSAALATALKHCTAIDGIWSDDAGVDERISEQHAAGAFRLTRVLADWQGLYFGGVAFKYQREVAANDLATAAGISRPYMDVLCTSGPGASGVTPENVHLYTPYVQAFLVGTGIEKRLGVLDRDKIDALQSAMRGWHA